MEQLIKVFPDKSYVKFGKGKFDNWCVYLYRPGLGLSAPADIEYFSFFKQLALSNTPVRVYNDFVSIYSQTNHSINPEILIEIHNTALKYNDSKLVEIWLVVLYAGMVAEENKEKAILKKRIKHLAMYQILLENYTPEAAAVFSKGKTWKVLDGECRNRGI